MPSILAHCNVTTLGIIHVTIDINGILRDT